MPALPEWTPVPVDGRLTGFVENWQGEAVAFGGRGTGPLAVRLGAAGVVAEAVPVGRGPITSACCYSAYDFVVGRVRPWLTTHDFDAYSHLPGCGCNERLEDATTLDAERLWTLCVQDSDVFVLTIRLDGWLVPGQMVNGAYPTPRGVRVVGDVAAAELVVCAPGDEELVVAGPLEGADGSTSPLWRWSSLHGWSAKPLDLPLDLVTDLWEGGWAAGHRQLRPVVQRHSGTRRSAYDPSASFTLPVDLDPDHPVVLLVGSPDLIALQAVAGPQVWVRREDGWDHHPLPSGRLDAAIHVRPEGWADGDDVVLADGRLFVTIDGQIWHIPHPIG